MSKVPHKIGLQLGDKGNDVNDLQSYLKKYGYIKFTDEKDLYQKYDLIRDEVKTIEISEHNVFDTNTEEALKRFQAFNGLPVNGILDEQTINLMDTPRCGVLDFVQGTHNIDVSKYAHLGTKWSRMNLTYRFENHTSDLNQAIVERAFRDAFSQWSSITPLSFEELNTGGDITIRFASGTQVDPPFDGSGNTLAYAYAPEIGITRFDEDEDWTDDNPPSGIDLQTVATHELGHILGLGHSSETNAVMYAYYSSRRRTLHSDDVEGIQALYGSAQWRYNQYIDGLWTNRNAKNAWAYIRNLGWRKIEPLNSDSVTNLLLVIVKAKAKNRSLNFYEKDQKIMEIYSW